MRNVSLSLLCSIALFGSTLYANDEEIKHVEPGSRPIAHTEWIKTQLARAEQDEAHQKDPSNDIDEQVLPEASCISTFKANARFTTPKTGVHYTSHSGAVHTPKKISPMGAGIELEDGSVWVIAPGDTYKVLNWLTTEDYFRNPSLIPEGVVITPNHAWFSPYLFCLTNQVTGVAVKVNLSVGPIYNDVFTHWIVAINYYTQEICLEDGTLWQLSGFDSSIFNTWLLNDTVIIGVNDGFLSSTKPNILINVNTLTYTRARCVF
jgi:hypothetical protein